jgi:hypothetical protein
MQGQNDIQFVFSKSTHENKAQNVTWIWLILHCVGIDGSWWEGGKGLELLLDVKFLWDFIFRMITLLLHRSKQISPSCNVLHTVLRFCGASCNQLPVKTDLSVIDWLSSFWRYDRWTELIHFAFPCAAWVFGVRSWVADRSSGSDVKRWRKGRIGVWGKWYAGL